MPPRPFALVAYAVAVTACADPAVEIVADEAAAITITPPVDPGELFIGGYDGTVRRFNLLTRSVTGTVSLGGAHVNVARSPDGATVYASGGFGEHTPYDPKVARIDVASLATVLNGGVARPGPIGVSPDGSMLYVGSYDGYVARIMDADFSEVAAWDPDIDGSAGFAWPSPDGTTVRSRLFALPVYGTPAMRAFTRGATWQPRPMSEDYMLSGIAAAPSSRTVVVAGTSKLIALDDTTGAELGSANSHGVPAAIAVKPGTALVYMMSGFLGLEVFAVDRSIFEPILIDRVATTTNICAIPTAISFSETQKRAYILCHDQLVVVETTHHSVVARFPGVGGFTAVWVP
jgi:DNA-binding beta-propeller fold protein YncE